MGLKYIGGPSYIFNGAYVDPMRSEECRLVLVTSEHEQAFKKEVVERIVEKNRVKVVAPHAILAELDVDEKYKVDVNLGDTFEVDDYTISVGMAEHPALKHAISYILKSEGKSAYFSGVTYPFIEMNKINVDYAVINMRGNGSMDELSGLKVAMWVKCRYLIPCGVKNKDRFKPYGKSVIFLNEGQELVERQ